MDALVTMLLVAWGAGLAAFVGGVLSRAVGPARTAEQREWNDAVVAFGGGVLLSAVALSLVPHALESLSTGTMAVTFALGGAALSWIDGALARRGGDVAQLVAMVTDFVPEALALGALFATDRPGAVLLAVFIAVQNLPEGFNAFRELVERMTEARALAALLAVSFLGPLAALAGHALLRDHVAATAGIMCFAAGGILYLVFGDIAPEAAATRRRTPPLGAVAGFLVGMIGTHVLG